MGKEVSQGEFYFMYNVGENVIDRSSLKTGTIVNLNEQEKTFEIKFDDGSTGWITEDNVSKFLLETDPNPNRTKLF